MNDTIPETSPSLNTNLTGKVALVTGASRGIGMAIAHQLAAAGATVIGTATSEQGAQNISAYLKEQQNPGTGIVMDVSESSSVKAGIAAIKDSHGFPDILVNNAGITRDNVLLRMDDDEWDDVINTNLSSVYRVTKACARGMTKKRWGRIINIGSVVGSTGNIGQANYAATKSGLEGLTRSMAREFGSRNVTANIVAPGFIETDMTNSLADEHKDSVLALVPLKRLGNTDDIAKTVLFLASDAASYITGASIPVNGGMHMP